MNEWLVSLQEFNSFLLLVFGGGISWLIKLLINLIKHRNDEQHAEKELIDKRFKSLEFANLAILHNKIYRQCADHIDAGFIAIDDLDDLDYLFRAYKDLGGNGTGETLYNKVKLLPNKKTEDDSNE